jgi:mannose-6-phosphate isomerase-like protein (cupin superfamily)
MLFYRFSPFVALCLLALYMLATTAVYAQEKYPYAALDPKPYDSSVDPPYSMFLGHWQNSMPRLMHGSIVFRDILTSLEGDDSLRPTRKSAVLVYNSAISHAVLQPGATAQSDKLDGEQQVFFVDSGQGVIRSGKKSYEIKKGYAFIVTPKFDFELQTTGDEALGMYVLTEPLPDGFKPNEKIWVKNRFENDLFMRIHWSNIDRRIVGRDDGMANYSGMTFVNIDAHTMAQPHSHNAGTEECWIAVKGDTKLLLGKQLFDLPSGSGYKIPDNGITAHSHINMGDEPVQLIHMMKNMRGDKVEYSQLDPEQFDPVKDPAIDMFMGDWRQSMPRLMHNSIVFRDMLTELEGPDHLHPTRKGAVLLFTQAVSYATLEPGAVATPSEMDRIQQVFYVNSGEGVIAAGESTLQLRQGSSFIITPGLDFTLEAVGDEVLGMYVVSEKIPDGAKLNETLFVTDGLGNPTFMKYHWANIDRQIISSADGMVAYRALTAVKLDANTMAQPHSHGEGVEEVWIALKGDISVLLGKELRVFPAGTAYKVPATGRTAHANINASESPVNLIHMMKSPPRRRN